MASSKGFRPRSTDVSTGRSGTGCSRLALVLAACAALGLAGCMDTAPNVQASAAADPAPRIAPRKDVSPAGAKVAFTSLSGVPANLSESFASALTQQLSARQVVTAPAASADYLVQGYVVAQTTANGTEYSYVWDVFGPDRKRRTRLEGLVASRTRNADPWAGANEATIGAIAGNSAGDIAAWLTHTPEAIAAARKNGKSAPAPSAGNAVAAAPAAGVPARALGYAPAR